MPNLSDLSPVTEDDYANVLGHLVSHRDEWTAQLRAGQRDLADHLGTAGYKSFLAEERPNTMDGNGDIEPGTVVVDARLKEAHAVVAKMRRFGEPLRVMLDVWGYRLVIASEDALEAVATCCEALWLTPEPSELLLRHGELQFAPWRDYRQRDHAGLSAATTNNYDQAIHLNRKAPFGIVEIQVLTFDLYRRVHCDPASEDSHDNFVARRQALFVRGDKT
ncbi:MULTISPECIES: hypothetical protein [unclassified Frankia]|uniref:hypothetical protein n=1 Tax=unclassified Frankia TaxID=2632575 RepID=UPI001EF709EE|nr:MULTISPECIES: hypothetical protein [unclassified Frankia]